MMRAERPWVSPELSSAPQSARNRLFPQHVDLLPLHGDERNDKYNLAVEKTYNRNRFSRLFLITILLSVLLLFSLLRAFFGSQIRKKAKS